MQNKFELSSEKKKVTMEDATLFGKLLSDKRNIIKKTAEEITLEFDEMNPSTVFAWEKGISFPDKEKLPVIAKAYGIELEELIRVFKISKEAREIEKNVKKR